MPYIIKRIAATLHQLIATTRLARHNPRRLWARLWRSRAIRIKLNLVYLQGAGSGRDEHHVPIAILHRYPKVQIHNIVLTQLIEHGTAALRKDDRALEPSIQVVGVGQNNRKQLLVLFVCLLDLYTHCIGDRAIDLGVQQDIRRQRRNMVDTVGNIPVMPGIPQVASALFRVKRLEHSTRVSPVAYYGIRQSHHRSRASIARAPVLRGLDVEHSGYTATVRKLRKLREESVRHVGVTTIVGEERCGRGGGRRCR